jgi:hypothetical protein
MKIQCKFCHTFNNDEDISCFKCSKYLRNKDEVAEKLFNRITQIEQNYQQEFQAIRKEISELNTIEDPILDPIVIPEIKITPIEEEGKEEASFQIKDARAASWAEPQEFKIPEPSEPSQFDLKVKELLGPINEGVELFFGAYEKFKTEGKLPIFFMTIAGIVAILFGFGYLMQLSLQYLGAYQELAKIGLGFTSAIVLVVIGIRLSQKGETLKEYGSALISLGIILNYLMIYFTSDLGNFPILSSGIFGFSLICINTLVSIFFSLKYQAKVISVITLIGGAFAPLYLNAMGDGRLYYLYLWLLAAGSCYVAKKTDWKTLNYLTFSVALSSLEFMVFTQSPSNTIYTAYYHLFAYLFFYISLFDGFKLKKKIVKTDIVILASSLSFFLYNVYNAFETNLVALGLVYIINSFVFFSILLMKWKNLSRDAKLVLFVVIGALIGFAIPSIFDQKLMGLFWSIEALLLVILGFHFSIPTVRKEGYILLAIAFGKLSLSSLSIVEHWEDTIWHQGFLNYIALGTVFASIWFIGRKHLKDLIGFENTLYSYTQEIVPLWLASVYLIVGYHLVGEWIFNLSVIPLFGFIYWKKHFNTKATDIIGLGHLMLFIAVFFISIQTTGSFHISDQKLYAQIAIIEFMAVLWGLKYFYSTLNIEDSNTFSFTQNLRVTFFCLLPLLCINLVRKHAFEFIELGFWIGALITYFLSKKLKYRALQVEFYVLSALGFFLCYMEFDSLGFVSGIAFIIAIVITEKAIAYETLQESSHKQYIGILPFSFSALIGSFVFSLNDEFLPLSFSISSFSLLVLTYFYDKIGPIKNHFKLAENSALLLNLCSLLSLVFFESMLSMILSIINLFLFSLLLNNKKNWFPVLYGQHWNGAMVLHQIECIITYGLILVFFGISITGPLTSILLAIHAIIVLFVAMKNQIKVLNKISIVLFAATLLKVVFHDINGFETTQKVIVLIILGLILLSASYGYVKLAKHFEKK